MDNPWTNLPKNEPFILDEDKEEITKFNYEIKEDYKIHLELLPEPFLGNPKSNIVLLNLNPGYHDEDFQFHNNNSYFIEILKKNLSHKEQNYPFYLLNPKIAESPGYKWWSLKLKSLIQKVGIEKVANELFCIEFFPYHSKKYKSINKILFSQEYNFNLLKESIKRNALIIIMRSSNKWLEFIPELKNYKFYKLKSNQNVSITKNNLGESFDEILKILK